MKKGILYSIGSIILVAYQPIIANSRPLVLYSYLFAALTCLVEAIFFFPLMLLERKKIKSNYDAEKQVLFLYSWRDNRNNNKITH